MKRMNFKALFAMLLCFVLCFAVCACGDTPPPECTAHVDENKDGKCDVCDALVEPEKEPEEKPDADELTLIEDGEAKFQIVVSKTSGGSVINKAVNNMVEAIEDLDVEVKQVTESQTNSADCEVFIGVPSLRGEDYAYDIHQLGPEGYIIKLIKGKILIAGGSEDGLVEAIEVFTEEFLGITKKTKEIDTVVVKASQSVEKIQDDYRVTALKLNGEDMKGYTIAANTADKGIKAIAEDMQQLFYVKTGYWFEIVAPEQADKSIVISVKENTYKGNGFSVKVADGRLTFETEFPDRLAKVVSDYLTTNVSVAQGEVNFTKSKHDFTKNMRDICYTEFGAKGDGATDDFLAIKKAHEYANKWGHNIKVSKSSYTFKIVSTMCESGKYESIPVYTDTNWNGCKIIIDDYELLPKFNNKTGNEYSTPIFVVQPDLEQRDLTASFVSVSKTNPLKAGATNIGFAPGEEGMIMLQSSERKLYVRYGANQDNGQDQQEIIMVDAEGNVFSDTPIMWEYTQIDKASFVPRNERKISIGNAKIQTIGNQAESKYNYFARNIKVHRSGTTIHDIEHWYDASPSVDEGTHGCPYNGITNTEMACDVVTENCRFEDPPIYETIGSGGVPVSMGSYAYGARKCYNIWWKNITQSNNHDENGITVSRPLMGTNYCKNLGYDGCDVGSFDAHCGLYNVTIKNTSITTVNLIGDGLAYFENVTFHAGLVSGCIALRDDYGASFKGDIVIKNCLIDTHGKDTVNLINTGNNYVPEHDFGYTCYLPKNITIDGFDTTNSRPVNLQTFKQLEKYGNEDISIPASEGGGGGINPYIPTEVLSISNAPNIKLKITNTPQFKNLKVVIDGTEIVNWKLLYGHNVK